MNTSHIIFKSARAIQRAEFLGKQLNFVNFFKDCYLIATKQPFGHLLINHDPKISDCLRYWSNITEPRRTVFCLPSDKAETTPLKRKEGKISILKLVAILASKEPKKYFRNFDSDVVLVLCESFHNVLLGTARGKVKDLGNYSYIFEKVLKKKIVNQ